VTGVTDDEDRLAQEVESTILGRMTYEVLWHLHGVRRKR